MSVFQQIVDVSGTAAFPTTPQVTVPFQAKSISVLNEDLGTSDDAFVSFDGQNDMGHLIPGATIQYGQRVTRVWLRRGAVGTAPTNIQVIAES